MSDKNVDVLAGDKTNELPSDSEIDNMFLTIVHEILYSPMNMILIAIIAFLIYKIIKDRMEIPSMGGSNKLPEPELPKLRRDFTIAELREYDGTQHNGRVLIAINGNVFDVTKGKRFYGPGGPYACFAGRDASRNFAKFCVTVNECDEYDDLSDLSPMEMESVREWEMQFKEKYDLVGKLLRKGEQPTNYEDEEDDTDKDIKTIDDSVSNLNGNDKLLSDFVNVPDGELRKRVDATSTTEEVS